MNCEEAISLIHDALDGEPAAADAERLDAHLQKCAACRKRHAQFAAMASGFAELRRVSEHPPQSAPVKPVTIRLMRVTRVAAVLAFVIGGGLAIRSLLDSKSIEPIPPGDAPMVKASAPIVELRLESAKQYLPVAESTDDPSIHIVWLHRQVQAVKKDAVAPISEAAPPTGPVLVATAAIGLSIAY